ncbi:hypothetical protein L2728_21705, partial [Shewanella chilikensis]|nr:hypothetical protein [Shewanella chilikensis]
NHQLPQSALDSKPPIMAMKEWHKTHPELFKKRPYNHAGLDNYSCLFGDYRVSPTGS